MTRSAIAAFMLGACSAIAPGQSHHPGDLTVEPYAFRTYDGRTHPAELGHLWVPEERRTPSTGLIQIGFVRFRTSAQTPQSPMVFLPGGPGIPGTVLGAVPVYFELLEKLQARSDVFLFDQRGIGTSSPHTECPQAAAPPADVFVNETNFRKALIARAAECIADWRAKGVRLESFSTAESAEDLEDLRRALGADKLSLLAHSYGTAVALEFLRHHEAQADRVVLAGAEGPGESLRLPSTFDFALRRISDLAASSASKEAFPDTWHEFQRVITELDREPITVQFQDPKTHEDRSVRVGAVLMQFVVMQMLPNGRRVGEVPALVYSLGRRDPALSKQAVQNIYNSLASGFTAMQFAIACSDGRSNGRQQLALEQASHSVFGDVPFLHLNAELCRQIGIQAANSDSLLPLWNSAHVLLVAGTLDSNAPPFQAEQLLWGLPNGEVLRVKNGFHETLPVPSVQALVAAFLAGSDAPMETVEIPPPVFVTPGDAAATPPANH